MLNVTLVIKICASSENACAFQLNCGKKQFLVFEFGTLAIFLMLSAQGLIGFLLYTRAESWRLHSSSYFGENGHNFKTLYLVQDEKSVERKKLLNFRTRKIVNFISLC